MSPDAAGRQAGSTTAKAMGNMIQQELKSLRLKEDDTGGRTMRKRRIRVAGKNYYSSLEGIHIIIIAIGQDINLGSHWRRLVKH